MTDRRWTGTWLSGVRSAGVDLGHPGERLGLPRSGPGSVAPFGRRLAALIIDWVLCVVIARWLLGVSPVYPLAVFAAENLLLVSMLGTTFGMRLVGVRVMSAKGRPGPLAVLIRTMLLCLALPALFMDRDQRGLHDRASATVVVRA